jgi:hypothetical protein
MNFNIEGLVLQVKLNNVNTTPLSLANFAGGGGFLNV